ncbi:hypothetical protein JAAARDRAFT_125646, partial [Jaapia argillacea MUCL 33604]
LDLPSIVVAGNQSAGKSSLIEAISGVATPRDAGTCTRCPMECRMSSSTQPWSCKIYIRWEFGTDGKRRDEARELEGLFCGPITDKSQVEIALRRAQAAVLHPDLPCQSFLSLSIDALKDLPSTIAGCGKPPAFSKNTVCVELAGPVLADLSFIDLPGLVSNAEDGVPEMIEELVVSHMKGNSLILVALPLPEDIETQKALRLARRQDPEGRRTIGVITKPDVTSVGSTKLRAGWLDVIEGRKDRLHHGYFCTRQPDDAERDEGISRADARSAEARFFAETSPWSASTHQTRFGTDNLVKSLSKLLTQLISDRLPKLQSETGVCLDKCISQLAALPKGVEGDPATCLLSLITAICSDFQRLVDGAVDRGQLIHESRGAFKDFKSAIHDSAPNFVPFPDAAHIEKRPTLGDQWGWEEGGDSTPIYLKDIHRHIEASATRELPDDVSFACKASLIDAYQKSWEGFAVDCFNRIRDETLRLLTTCIRARVAQFDDLRQLLWGLVSELVDHHYAGCLKQLQVLLKLERSPFTQNTHYYDTCREKWLSKYKDARANKTSTSPLLRPPDEYSREILVMAQVRAYFQVSYKRIIDNIPLMIDLQFVKAVGEDLQPFLVGKLGLGNSSASERCASYLVEDPSVVTKRDELIARKNRLELVATKLYHFGL